MPRVYEARASIFVRQEAPSLRLPGDLGALALPGQNANPQAYALAVLQSDDFARQLLRALRLTSRADFTSGEQMTSEQALKKLQRSVRVEEDRKGLIAVTASAASADLAAELANAYVNRFLMRVNEENRRKSGFIAGKIRSLEQDLASLEDRLKELSSRAEVINLSEQTRAAVQQALSLQQQIQEATSELTALESDLKNTGDLAELARLKARKEALEASRQEMQAALDRLRSEMKDVPAVALRQARLQREIDNKAKLYQVLSQQHELAQIDEQSESRSYQVMDRALPPEKPARPKLLVNLAVSFMLGVALGVAVNMIISELRPA
jgi:tyrosine-protein kinase Etk/Wzc